MIWENKIRLHQDNSIGTVLFLSAEDSPTNKYIVIPSGVKRSLAWIVIRIYHKRLEGLRPTEIVHGRTLL